MIKAITFSIYNDKPKYLTGLLKNIELAKEFYPDWEVYVYYDDTVPSDFINSLSVKLFDCTGNGVNKLFWRFFADIDVFMVRDADSRIGKREQQAVNDWITSGRRLHIMRDHPHHKFKIMGGMWGFVPKGFSIKDRYDKWVNVANRGTTLETKGMDQLFLADVIYPEFAGDSLIHDSVKRVGDNSISFPSKMENCNFVGEIFDENDNKGEQYNVWKHRHEF